MALTPFRWLAIAVGGAVMLFYLSLRLPEAGANALQRRAIAAVDTVEERLRARATGPSNMASRLARRLRAQQLVDSTRLVRARRPASQGIRLFLDDALGSEDRRTIEGLVGRATAEKSGDRIPIDLVFVLDTAFYVRRVEAPVFGSSTSYTLPASESDQCMVLVRIGREMTGRDLQQRYRTQAAADQLLGPCAYYAAFGMPGPGIAPWFAKHGWSLATDGSWTEAPTSLYAGSHSRAIVGSMLWNDMAFYGRRDVSALPCLTGDTLSCLRAARLATPVDTMAPGQVTTPYLSLGVTRYNATGFGNRGGALVAAMVQSLGRDRFQRFWSSSEPPAAAFQEAAGQSAGQWIATWMRQQYGAVERGPKVSSKAVATSSVLFGLSLLATVYATTRRRYS